MMTVHTQNRVIVGHHDNSAEHNTYKPRTNVDTHWSSGSMTTVSMHSSLLAKLNCGSLLCMPMFDQFCMDFS